MQPTLSWDGAFQSFETTIHLSLSWRLQRDGAWRKSIMIEHTESPSDIAPWVIQGHTKWFTTTYSPRASIRYWNPSFRRTLCGSRYILQSLHKEQNQDSPGDQVIFGKCILIFLYEYVSPPYTNSLRGSLPQKGWTASTNHKLPLITQIIRRTKLPLNARMNILHFLNHHFPPTIVDIWPRPTLSRTLPQYHQTTPRTSIKWGLSPALRSTCYRTYNCSKLQMLVGARCKTRQIFYVRSSLLISISTAVMSNNFHLVLGWCCWFGLVAALIGSIWGGERPFVAKHLKLRGIYFVLQQW